MYAYTPDVKWSNECQGPENECKVNKTHRLFSINNGNRYHIPPIIVIGIPVTVLVISNDYPYK